MNGQCKGCRHWDYVDHEWGVCTLATRDHPYAHPPASVRTKAIVGSHTTAFIWLSTTEDFGCVQFAADTQQPDGGADDAERGRWAHG